MDLEVGEVGPLFLLPMYDRVKTIIEQVLSNEDAELVDLIFRKESGRQILCLLVDKEGGVNLEDCVSLNKKIGIALDEADAISEHYVLEVDSPGIDRWFSGKRDYERSIGRMVRVTLSEAVLDKKEYIGRLEEVLEDSIKIDVKKKGIIEILFTKIVRARQEVEL
ncbi:MAG: ribosome maturation factor RimP [Candidatus Omnitrophica bacterium]|nr:ribosome maturation factor RimP [Candidatus Omnitrophota bacterium]